MKRKFVVRFILGIFLLAVAVGLSPAAETAGDRDGILSTGIEDQTGVALTIYNVNLGLVKDQRSIPLPAGDAEVRFMDVASEILPTSVYLKSLTDPDSLLILEQNYEYDLLNPQKLLDKYVGKEVKLYQYGLRLD